MSWSGSSGATLYVGGITDIATGSAVVTINTSGTSTAATLSPGKQYQWYVYACNSTGCSSSSALYYFQTPTPADTVTITSGPSGTPNPVTSGGTVNLSAVATDSLNHPLSYFWVSVCNELPSNGSFNNPSTQNSAWTAPTNTTGTAKSCTLTVTVNDGLGHGDTKSFQETVSSADQPTIAWTAPPSSSVTSGQPFSVAWSISGGSPTHVNVHWDPTNPGGPGNPSGNINTPCQQSSTSCSTDSPTSSPASLTAPTVTTSTGVRYLVHATVNGTDIFTDTRDVTVNPVPPATGTLQVTVRRSDTNAPLSGASVSLSGGPSSPASQPTVADGTATFSNLLPGLYTATASLSEFQGNFTQAVVSADTKAEITISLTPTQTGKIPLIFIPGILGTRLVLPMTIDDDEIWPDPAEFGFYGDRDNLKPLRQGEQGENIAGLQPTQVIDSIYGNDIYGDFITFLKTFESQGYRVVTFPYDWRLNLMGQARTLANLIEQLRKETGRDRVDIVAHSMGGLLAKAYLNRRDVQGKKINEGTVGKLIMIATPHFGSAYALAALLFGENKIGGWGLTFDKGLFAWISTNMPTAYQLLPSEKFHGYKLAFIEEEGTGPHAAIIRPLGYDNLLATLANPRNIWPRKKDYDEPLNPNIKAWVGPHNDTDGWDNWVPTDSILKANTDLFYGIGLETTGTIWYTYTTNNFASGTPRYERMEGKERGDGTVPAFSAKAGDLPEFNGRRSSFETETLQRAIPNEAGGATLVVQQNSAEHLEILKHSKLRNRISDILHAGGTSSSSIVAAPLEATSVQMSQAVATVQSEWIEVALDSEVATLHLFDALGNHVGPTAHGGSDAKIAVSQYLASGKVKVAIVPEGGTYTLKIQATGAGQADLRITEYLEGDPAQILHYRGISLGPSGQAQMVINEVVPTLVLEVDGNGDGVTELQMTANNPPVANASLDQAVNEGAWVVLDGAHSVNPYGGPLTYQWTQTAGPAVTLSGDTTATPSFSAPSVDADTTVAFSLIVNDGSANSNPDTVTVLVRNQTPLAVWTAGLPAGEQGAAYAYGLLAEGGTPPYTWYVIGGKLPTGLTLDTAGTVTGTPTKAKTKTFTVQVTDATGSPTTQNLSLQIVKSVKIKTKKLRGGTVGIPYSSLLKTAGGIAPLTFSVVGGALPPGLTLDPGTGQVTGTPTVAGPFDFVAQVASSGGSSHQKNIRIKIK